MYAKAEPLYVKAMEIYKEVLGEGHRLYAGSLVDLAVLYETTGQYARAEPLYAKAVQICEKACGDKHPYYAYSASALAEFYRWTGDYAKAKALYMKAVEIYGKTFGDAHPACASILDNLASLHGAADEWDTALHYEAQARRAIHQHIVRTLSGLSESEQLLFLRTQHERGYRSALSLGLACGAGGAVPAAEWLLNGKALTWRVGPERARLARVSRHPEATTTMEELTSVRSILARLSMNPPRGGDFTEYREQMDHLTDREQLLSKRLGQLAGRERRDDRWVSLEEGRKGIGEKTVLLDLARFEVRSFKATGQEPRWQAAHYAAWVIPPRGKLDVKLIDLGEAAVIDEAVAAYRRAVEGAREAIDEGRYAASLEEVMARGRALANLVWGPLREHVKDVEHLIISPDGELCLLPWEVLPVEGGKFLVEEKRISYVGAGRDVVAFADQASKPSSAVVFADPDFDLSPEAQAQAVRQLLPAVPAEPQAQPSGALALRSGSRRSRDFGAMHFDSLPGFGAEAKSIVEPLTKLTGQRPKIYTQAQALEGVFKQVRRPGVLTVHTHGWFLEDQDWSAGGADRGLAWELRNVGGIGPQRLFAGARIENPLLRCGLALSGANVGAESTADTQTDLDDGIVTGLEIVSVDLTGTELVVLSACQTGVGEVKIGEGVYGLRRAFYLAGAKSLLVSLWRVPDEPTQALMTSFFKRWAGGMSKVDALRAAQRDVMGMTFELDVERGVQGISPQKTKVTVSGRHPYFWGPFILVGDWR